MGEKVSGKGVDDRDHTCMAKGSNIYIFRLCVRSANRYLTKGGDLKGWGQGPGKDGGAGRLPRRCLVLDDLIALNPVCGGLRVGRPHCSRRRYLISFIFPWSQQHFLNTMPKNTQNSASRSSLRRNQVYFLISPVYVALLTYCPLHKACLTCRKRKLVWHPSLFLPCNAQIPFMSEM
jgi:hypothetical protein